MYSHKDNLYGTLTPLVRNITKCQDSLIGNHGVFHKIEKCTLCIKIKHEHVNRREIHIFMLSPFLHPHKLKNDVHEGKLKLYKIQS